MLSAVADSPGGYKVVTTALEVCMGRGQCRRAVPMAGSAGTQKAQSTQLSTAWQEHSLAQGEERPYGQVHGAHRGQTGGTQGGIQGAQAGISVAVVAWDVCHR